MLGCTQTLIDLILSFVPFLRPILPFVSLIFECSPVCLDSLFSSPVCVSYPQVDLTVLVLDVNDNAPVFQRQDYTTTVPEDAALGTEVLRVLATSADIGTNADIIYQIQSGNELGKFAIDRKLGRMRSM